MSIIEYIENVLGLRLFEYQKVILRQIEEKRNVYITFPPNAGRTDLRILAEVCKQFMTAPKGE